MAIPQIDIIQLDSITDPSGTRNLGATMDGFVKFLDTSTSGHLDFGAMDITNSGVFADTKMLFFRPTSFGDGSEVFNFRFFLSSTTAWSTGNYQFYWQPQIGYEAGKIIDDGNPGIPVSLPASSNVVSTQSGTYIQAIAESGCSEYIYLTLFADTDVPVGTYGGAGNGGFRYRLTFDFK